MLVTVSNGGDNLSLYIPLFAIHTLGEAAFFVALFLVLTALWCCAGYALVKHRCSARRCSAGATSPCPTS